MTIYSFQPFKEQSEVKMSKIPKATHSGTLTIGNTTLPCAVLEDGTRIIASASFLKALGRPWRGKYKRTEMPSFLAANNLKPFIDEDLTSVLDPIEYETPRGGKKRGFKAELIPKVCEVYLKARDASVLKKNQEKPMIASDIIMRSLAKVGIIALIDEATGYQYVRDRDELNRILEAYIAKELLPWTKRFPDEFYRQLFRLRGWQYSPFSVKRPQYVGKLTNKLVYEKLPPGVLKELREKNPVTPKGYRKHRHHQFLTEDIGNPHLGRHIASVTTLMRAAPNWKNFERLFKRAFRKEGEHEQIEMPFMEKSEN